MKRFLVLLPPPTNFVLETPAESNQNISNEHTEQ